MTFNEWTTDLQEKEDAFFDALERIKTRAFKGNGWLYIESQLHDELNGLVRLYDPLHEKHIKEVTEMLMKHLLKDQYVSKAHKPHINDPLSRKRQQKQKKQVSNSLNSRKATRIIFVPKPA